MSPDLLAILAIALTARRKLLRAITAGHPSPRRNWWDIFTGMAGPEALLARTLRDGQVLAWLQGGADVVKSLPAEVRQGLRDLPMLPAHEPTGTRPPLPPETNFPDRPGDAAPVVRLPAIEKAARYLQTRLAYTPDEFRLLDDDARSVAFTVAKAVSVDAVEKVKAALAEAVGEGDSLKVFRRKIADVIDESALSPHRVENLFRTHVAKAYATGHWDVRDHPLISDQFPYVLRDCVGDGRTRATHLAFLQLGMTLTNGKRGPIYRADDPVIRRYASPWEWQCRCADIFLSAADAARHGVREAIEWDRTGIPPAYPEFVPDPGFPLPNGWVPVGNRLRPII